jgi:hypothetical protein
MNASLKWTMTLCFSKIPTAFSLYHALKIWTKPKANKMQFLAASAELTDLLEIFWHPLWSIFHIFHFKRRSQLFELLNLSTIYQILKNCSFAVAQG